MVTSRHSLVLLRGGELSELDRDSVTCGAGTAGNVPSQRGSVAGDDLVVAAAGGLELPFLIGVAAIAGPLLDGGAVAGAAVGGVGASPDPGVQVNVATALAGSV